MPYFPNQSGDPNLILYIWALSAKDLIFFLHTFNFKRIALMGSPSTVRLTEINIKTESSIITDLHNEHNQKGNNNNITNKN